MFLFFTVSAVSAATFTVTKTADTNDGVCNSDCSLREAVAAAASGDTIVFASPLFDTAQTVQVNGQVTLDKSLTINGRGANLTTIQNIAAASATSRIFLINGGTTVNLSGLTITGGNLTSGVAVPGCGASAACGGGIHSEGNLTLTNCVVSNNAASNANFVLGGGIYTITGTLTLINTTVSGNSSNSNIVSGGGIYIQDNGATIVNSTISGNTAVGVSFSLGGGIYTNTGALNIFNSTVTNNSVPNGTDGGGGLGIGGTATVNAVNTIISGNTANANPDLNRSLLAASTNNLVGGNAGLLPLGNYGGTTPTHALLPTSEAVNGGNNCVVTQTCTVGGQPVAVTVDQRGRGRDSRVDIGAYEVVGLSVTKTADTNDGVCNSDCSLREAIAAAQSGDTIFFASPLFDTPQTIQTNGQLTINKTLVINGRGSNLTTIQNIAAASGTSRVLLVDPTGNLTLSNVTVTGGSLTSNNYGAGIMNRNRLTVIGCQISGNSVAGIGGGGGIATGTLFGGEPSLTLIMNSTISGNQAQIGGGIIFNQGNSTVINSTISGNTATSGGGGIYNSAGTTNIVNSTITANSTSVGGGIGLEASTVILRNSIIAQNTGSVGRPDISRNPNATFTSNGNNLIGNSTDTISPITWQASDVLNQNSLLAPLGFYGGATMTHPLLSTSPAVNAGNNCVTNRTCSANNSPVFLSTDQRGASRVGTVDIGAYEVNNAANGGFRASLPIARVGSNYNFVIAPNNGTATYQLTGGTLPSGVNLTTNFAPNAFDKLNELAPNAVVSLSGIPTQSGSFDFTVTTTAGGNTVVTDYSLNVIPVTSANVSIAGRVFDNDGNALRNAFVLLTDGSGNTRKVQTGSFGVYRFDDLAVGQTYIVQIVSKKFSFAPQTVYLTDNLTELNFTAQ